MVLNEWDWILTKEKKYLSKIEQLNFVQEIKYVQDTTVDLSNTFWTRFLD